MALSQAVGVVTTTGVDSAPSTAAPTSTPRQARRAVWAALVGGSLESFDFYVFAYFSALFAPAVFFPPQDRAAGIIASFALIGVSYVIRPVVAVLFGKIGDRIGRRMTLLLTITIMGVATGLIGVLPGYGQIGIAAPILLLLGENRLRRDAQAVPVAAGRKA